MEDDLKDAFAAENPPQRIGFGALWRVVGAPFGNLIKYLSKSSGIMYNNPK